MSRARAVIRNLKRKEQPNDQTQYTGLADLGSIGTSAGPLIDEPPALDVHSDDCAFPVTTRHDSSEVASAVKRHPMFMKLVQAHYACRKVVTRTHKLQSRSHTQILSPHQLRSCDDKIPLARLSIRTDE